MPRPTGRNVCQRSQSSNATVNNQVQFLPPTGVFIATTPPTYNVQGSAASRQQRVMDFYNRKSVSQRNQGQQPLFATEFSPPNSPPMNFTGQSAAAAFHGNVTVSPSIMGIHPTNDHGYIPFSGLVMEGRSLNGFFQATENQIGNHQTRIFENAGIRSPSVGIEPSRSFVVLQPLVGGMQDLIIQDAHQSQRGVEMTSFSQISSPVRSTTNDTLFTNPGHEEELNDADDADDDDEMEAPELFAEDTMCTICCGVFKDPRILTCGHTFCLKCLVRMQKRQQQPFITCPVCREETFVQGNNLKLLTKNFTVRNLVETIRLSTKTEKTFQSQMDQESNTDSSVSLEKIRDVVELKETRRVSLMTSGLKGMTNLKQKIYIIFEYSDVISVLSSKTSLFGNSKKEERISLGELSWPMSIASSETNNLLFILEKLSDANGGIFKSRVWKISPSEKMKSVKWIKDILSTESTVTTKSGDELILLARDGSSLFMNFYRTGGGSAELSRQIMLVGEIISPLSFTTTRGGSEFVVCHLMENDHQTASSAGQTKRWTLSVVSMDGKPSRNLYLRVNSDISALVSDSGNRLFFIEHSTKDIFMTNSQLENISRLKFKNLSPNATKVVGEIDSNRFLVGYEHYLCFYSF